MIVFCREENRESGNFSATTAIAATLTFALGGFAVIGDMRVAAAAAVATAGILAAREDIHSWVARITWPELRSALVLLAMTFIVLPVVPDDPIGPFGGTKPREIWLIAIVLAGSAYVRSVSGGGFSYRVLPAVLHPQLPSPSPMRGMRLPVRRHRLCSPAAWRWRPLFRSCA
jgi:hypothetical protein